MCVCVCVCEGECEDVSRLLMCGLCWWGSAVGVPRESWQFEIEG